MTKQSNKASGGDGGTAVVELIKSLGQARGDDAGLLLGDKSFSLWGTDDAH